MILAAVIAAISIAASHAGFFFFRDNFSTHYPVKFLSAAAYRAFEIPYWNFADGGGQPLAGNPNTLTFYPDNVLYLLLPGHAAFNLHFLIHLAIGFAAMRALTRSWFGAWFYLLSGAVISSTSFYNLVVAVAMIPLALLAAERRSTLLLGISFGLMLLAAEPVMLVAMAIAAGIAGLGRLTLRDIGIAAGLALAIASPQLIAFAEIAREVERSVPISANAMLAVSLQPARLLELVWPFGHVLNEPGGDRVRLFSTIFAGIIVIPALVRRSRYVVIAGLMLFFALGRFNPVVAAIAEVAGPLRVMRFPEKFVLPLVVALVVLSAELFKGRLRRSAPPNRSIQTLWIVVTFLPLIWTLWRALPVDWFSAYRVERPVTAGRVHSSSTVEAGSLPAREEYRQRARAGEALFGATAGMRYAITPTPDRMHSLRSRMVVERFASAPAPAREKYLRIANLPEAYVPVALVIARNIYEETAVIERPSFDERRAIVALSPAPLAPARVTSYVEEGQTIRIGVDATGPSLVVVNQTWFSAWDARVNGLTLSTMPVNVDRLGIIVPAGRTAVTLRFGRQRAAAGVSWLISSAVLLAALFAYGVEERNRRAREIERAGDEHAARI